MINLTLEECVNKLQEATEEISKEALDKVEKAAAENSSNTTKGIDYVALDIPLFMRLLEFAREDSKSDLDLHVVTENILRIQQGKNESNQAGSFLTMEDYNDIVADADKHNEEKVEEKPAEEETKAKEENTSKFRGIVQEKIKESQLDEGIKDVLKNTLAGAAVAGTLATAQPSMAANYQPTDTGAIADTEFSQMVDDQNKQMEQDMATYMSVVQDPETAYKNINNYPKLEELDGKTWPVVLNQDGTLMVKHPGEDTYSVLKNPNK